MENHHIILEPLNKPRKDFEYLSPKDELEDFHNAAQRVFAKEITSGKITVTLVKVKRCTLLGLKKGLAFHGMTDLQIRTR